MAADPNAWLTGIPLAPPDPILGVAAAYRADPAEKKVNLSIGAYRTEQGVPYVFKAVREAEAQLVANENRNKEYQPIQGNDEFNTLSRRLIFGPTLTEDDEKNMVSIQVLSGTGALRTAAEFLRKFKGDVPVYNSDPTWGNHFKVFQNAGFSQTPTYPYWNAENKNVNFDAMKNCLQNDAPEGSIIVLHACAHNPTGVDLSRDQMKEIGGIMQARNLFPLFDSAYQGFASGDLDEDATAIRDFREMGFTMVVSQSYAKNFGLYGERIGCLHTICPSPEVAANVSSQLKMVVRAMISNPPIWGAAIVATVLKSPELTQSWKDELKQVADRIIEMRALLRQGIENAGTPGDWSHITSQIGMFSYTGLTEAQCANMVDNFHIYLLKSGRISMAGINTGNVEYVANAIKESVTNF